eukprot:6172557-Pleurochrysis_carterae.AAC.5
MTWGSAPSGCMVKCGRQRWRHWSPARCGAHLDPIYERWRCLGAYDTDKGNNKAEPRPPRRAQRRRALHAPGRARPCSTRHMHHAFQMVSHLVF